MRKVIYTMIDGDGIYGLPYCSQNEHFASQNIKDFEEKVGQYVEHKWVILGYFDSKTGELISEQKDFNYEDFIMDKPTEKITGVDTSVLADEVEGGSNETVTPLD